MNRDSYSIILVWSDDDEAFVATVPELRGCMAHGETRAEAIGQTEIAINNWLDTARELGRQIPPPRHLADYEKELDERVARSSEELKAEMSQAIIDAAPAITPGIVEALAKYFAKEGEDVWLSYSKEIGMQIWRRGNEGVHKLEASSGTISGGFAINPEELEKKAAPGTK
jgi:predicted RNase H-like HicB family nuclease